MELIDKLMDPALFKIFSELTSALVSFTPEHFKRIECVIELGAIQGRENLFFHIGSPDFPQESVTSTDQRVADWAEELLGYWEEKEEPFPGFRIVIEQQADGQWKNSIERIDAIANFQSPIPRPLNRAVRLLGYGLTITPVGPFNWYQTINPAGINASRYVKTNDGRTLATHQALLIIKDGTVEVQMQGTAKESQVLNRGEGPGQNEWIIETPTLKCSWPSQFSLIQPAASGAMFDLVQGDNTLIYVSGPFTKQQFDIDDVAADYQTVIARGSSPCQWAELGYQINQEEWRQRKYAITYDQSRQLCLGAQCRANKADQVWLIAEAIFQTLQKIAP